MSFSWDLFERLCKERNENTVMSGFSAEQTLGALCNGAVNETQSELLKVLHGKDIRELNERHASLLKQITPDEHVQLKIRNSIWAKDANINREYQNTVRSVYNTDTLPLESAGKVNEWISSSTDGMIKQGLDTLDPSCDMLLINTTCFEGKWKLAFDPSATSTQLFTDFEGCQRECSLMHQQDQMWYQETTSFSSVLKDYGDHYEAVMVLPKHTGREPMLAVIKHCRQEPTCLSPQRYSSQKLDLLLPRFELRADLLLNEPLRELGLRRSFNGSAQFTQLSGGNGHLSQVLQESFMRVDEAGTQAASVTVGMMTRAIVIGPIFRCDRPFLFFIRHKATQAILFQALIQTI